MGAAGSNYRIDGRLGVFATGLLPARSRASGICYFYVADTNSSLPYLAR
jgi:hypothetical protein